MSIYLIIVYSLFFLFLFLFLFVLTFFEKKRLYSFLKREKEKADIMSAIADISVKVQREEENLPNYPNIAIYLSQVSLALRFSGFDVEEISVSTLKELPERAIIGFDKNVFCKELLSLPKESRIYKLVISCSNAFGRIYRLKYPFKYFCIEFKKNIYLQILKILANLSSFRSNSFGAEVEDKAASKSLNFNFVNEPELLAS